jgi:ABC-type lipoprotein export system ATPase subunit
MLQLRNVSKYYYSNNKITLGLSKIDLDFHVGEFIVITGESGSGKSTLLNVLSGLDTYEQGKMFINDSDISHFSVSELEEYRRKYIGFVFQNYNIVENYTVLENIEMALIIQGFNKEKRRERTFELIDLVGLKSKANVKASKLSGGEKQRVVIARALAKDSKIIVCDEPTGNLDSKTSKKIIQLLYSLRKDKLIIVVSHNSSNYQEFLTREIRLFDGEVVEDKLVRKNKKIEVETDLKPFKPKVVDLFFIGLKNVLSVPRKSFFTYLIISFIIVAFIFLYGANLEQRNTSSTFETPYFNNSVDSRIVITKYNTQEFTLTELETINSLEYVREVIEYDYVFDTTLLNKYYNESYDFFEYISYKILPVSSLDEFDLISGALPLEQNQIVISENNYYSIGDTINLSNQIHIQEIGFDNTLDYSFVVVGIVESDNNLDDYRQDIYFTKEDIVSFRYDALLEYSQMFITVSDVREYSVYQDIRIDDSLADFNLLGYDAMFFDMCYDFGLETCIVDDFIDAHEFTFKSITRFESNSNEIDIVFTSVPFVEGSFGQAIYMNSTTLEYFLDEGIFQISAIVYDMYEANNVVEELDEINFNVFYPHGVVTVEQGLLYILNNIRLFISLIFTLVVVYFIGYFVMRNVMISKKKNYLIYRSVGASKETINTVSIFEIMIITIISFALIVVLLIVNENFKTVIPKYLRYFEIKDYLILLGTIFGVMYLMGKRFNRKIFAKSVISSLRDLG